MVLHGGAAEDATPNPAAARKPPARDYVELLRLLDSQVQLHLNPPHAAVAAAAPSLSPAPSTPAVPVEAPTAPPESAATETRFVPVAPRHDSTTVPRRQRFASLLPTAVYAAAALLVAWAVVRAVTGPPAKTTAAAVEPSPNSASAAPPLPTASAAAKAAPPPAPAARVDPQCPAAAAALALCTPNLPR